VAPLRPGPSCGMALQSTEASEDERDVIWKHPKVTYPQFSLLVQSTPLYASSPTFAWTLGGVAKRGTEDQAPS